MGMTAEQAQAWLSETAARTGGASVESSDVDNLVGKSDADIEEHKRKLTDQYTSRSKNTPGGSGGETPAQQQQPAPTNVMQSWQQAPQTDPRVLQLLEENNARAARAEEAAAAEKAAAKVKADALYGQLQTRASQSTVIDPNDPNIRPSVDAFRADQTRAQRDYISDAAEAAGPIGNIRGESRMAAEQTGINTAKFRAEAETRELLARREEITSSLAQMGGMVSGEQQANIQRELALLDNRIKQSQTVLQGRDLDIKQTLGMGSLGVQNRALDIESLLNEMRNRQFYDDLGLRAEDRASYYDIERRRL